MYHGDENNSPFPTAYRLIYIIPFKSVKNNVICYCVACPRFCYWQEDEFQNQAQSNPSLFAWTILMCIGSLLSLQRKMSF